ncbi:LacI family DNA-binding transcriptional regulator [Rhinopithecimicrobium faecis]|uniref:LacI family DNA-binding transcriptional regulator n=1 Tax=Rhinopithecimicrobium faecis TaxID=2820698 RepID=UPI0033656746
MIKKGMGMKLIAEKLEISISTVSRALRDAHDVNPVTRQKVMSLAKELNFKPNKNASALASGSTKNIGVVIPFITNYYFSTVISGIQEEAISQGYQIVLYISNDDLAREIQLINNLESNNLDGLLVSISSNTTSTQHYEDLMNEGCPIVFFDRIPAHLNASKVMQGDFEGAYLATNHLIQKGYRKIAHLAGPSGLDLTNERLNGYLCALKDAGISNNPSFIKYAGFTRNEGEVSCRELYQGADQPDAIFAVNDLKAVGAIQALKKMGMRVGEQVGVIGFTDDPIALIIEPNLTTIHEPAFEIGKQSCQLLIKHIKNPSFEARTISLACTLVERDSV